MPKKIVAWVNKREQKHLEKLNQQFCLSFVFVNNFEQFSESVYNGDIPLFLRRKANNYFRKLETLLQRNPEKLFYAYVPNNSYELFVKESSLSNEGNLISLDETKLFQLLKIKSL